MVSIRLGFEQGPKPKPKPKPKLLDFLSIRNINVF